MAIFHTYTPGGIFFWDRCRQHIHLALYEEGLDPYATQKYRKSERRSKEALLSVLYRSSYTLSIKIKKDFLRYPMTGKEPIYYYTLTKEVNFVAELLVH